MESIEEIKLKFHSIVSNHGENLIEDTNSLETALTESEIDNVTVNQIVYLIKSSHIENYIGKDRITLIDVNNIILDIEKNTGLKKSVVKEYLSIILYAFGYQALSDELNSIQLVNTKSDMNTDSSFDTNTYEDDLKRIATAIDNTIRYKDPSVDGGSNNENTINHYNPILKKLTRQGNPEALYLTGKCYYYGIATEKNLNEAKKYFSKSADLGYSQASAFLGDICFNDCKYTDAYNYYTDLGAVALSNERKNNLSAILNYKKRNIALLVGVVAFLVFSFVFNILMMTGAFCPSGCTHYPSGVLSMILSVLIFVLIILKSIFKKYDTPKLLLTLMAVLSCIFTFIALVI